MSEAAASSAGKAARPGGGPIAFIDSSAIVTLVDADDASHAAAVEAYRSLIRDGYRLFTTNHVLDEAFELLRIGAGMATAQQWLRDQQLTIYYVQDADLAAATALIVKREASQQISLTDALSMVVMERLGVTDAFAVDPAILSELS
jgi:predicted nucleic acid-binding protein